VSPFPKDDLRFERLVDLDVDPIEVGGVIYIASYNGGAAAISELDGDVLWRNESISSYTGLSHDFRICIYQIRPMMFGSWNSAVARHYGNKRNCIKEN